MKLSTFPDAIIFFLHVKYCCSDDYFLHSSNLLSTCLTAYQAYHEHCLLCCFRTPCLLVKTVYKKAI
ncbi:hypothetical protein TSPI_10709 [Trichinella spiralis]|uniref:Uncharacterized protein n=1 Tax=Trichinella spiralis TaxID=6334 RepID=A0ABR3KHB9_TRISP